MAAAAAAAIRLWWGYVVVVYYFHAPFQPALNPAACASWAEVRLSNAAPSLRRTPDSVSAAGRRFHMADAGVYVRDTAHAGRACFAGRAFAAGELVLRGVPYVVRCRRWRAGLHAHAHRHLEPVARARRPHSRRYVARQVAIDDDWRDLMCETCGAVSRTPQPLKCEKARRRRERRRVCSPPPPAPSRAEARRRPCRRGITRSMRARRREPRQECRRSRWCSAACADAGAERHAATCAWERPFTRALRAVDRTAGAAALVRAHAQPCSRSP